jgi:hypothetical protein
MTDSLDLLALGFAVRTDGALDPRSRTSFRRFASARGICREPEEADRALAAAVRRYRTEDALFVCAERPCAGAFGFDVSTEALARVTERAEMPAIATGCQGHCKHKPIVSLRVGGRREMFGGFTTPDDRADLYAYARAAHASGSTFVPGCHVEPFRFDLEHGGGPAGQLRSVEFLSGRFSGTGSYLNDGYTFSKEVVGRYEPGGRFLTLHMQASYPTADGGTDLHRALVVVGSASQNGERLFGKAFTDGGEVLDYDVEWDGGYLAFDDQPPDHAMRPKRVRKTICPTSEGYDELLLVDWGRGLEPYYRVVMERRSTVAPSRDAGTRGNPSSRAVDPSSLGSCER